MPPLYYDEALPARGWALAGCASGPEAAGGVGCVLRAHFHLAAVTAGAAASSSTAFCTAL